MKSKGFTLIEIAICMAILGILLVILTPAVSGKHNVKPTVNGYVETSCVNGYTFVIGPHGAPAQVLDSEGHGVPCQ